LDYLDTESIQELTWRIQKGEDLIPKGYENIAEWIEKGFAHREAIECYEDGIFSMALLRKKIAEAFVLGVKVGERMKGRSYLQTIK
jgi:hypothetical protein